MTGAEWVQTVFSGGVLLLLLNMSRQLGKVEEGLNGHVKDAAEHRVRHDTETEAKFQAHEQQHNREQLR